MKLNYEEIVVDLKKAKESILSLRKEREALKNSIDVLEKSEFELKTKIKALIEENDQLKLQQLGRQGQNLDEAIFRSSTLYAKLEKIEKQNPFQFSLENFYEMVKQKNYSSVISQLADLTLRSLESNSPSPKSSKIHMMKTKESDDLEEQDFVRLVNESSDLLEVLEKQNERISEIGKNISRTFLGSLHKTSHSMANLRVPDLQSSIYKEPLSCQINNNKKLRK